MSTTAAERAAAGRQAHEAFFEQLRRLAGPLGWCLYRVFDSRKSPQGWVDLVLIHLEQRRILFRELKTGAARPTRAQRECLAALTACGLNAGVWRPHQEAQIVRELRGE